MYIGNPNCYATSGPHSYILREDCQDMNQSFFFSRKIVQQVPLSSMWDRGRTKIPIHISILFHSRNIPNFSPLASLICHIMHITIVFNRHLQEEGIYLIVDTRNKVTSYQTPPLYNDNNII